MIGWLIGSSPKRPAPAMLAQPGPRRITPPRRPPRARRSEAARARTEAGAGAAHAEAAHFGEDLGLVAADLVRLDLAVAVRVEEREDAGEIGPHLGMGQRPVMVRICAVEPGLAAAGRLPTNGTPRRPG